MTILKRLVVTTGTYEKDGQTKKRYKTIGHVHSGKHGDYITLAADVNLAAFPRKEGDDRVMVSLYDEDDKQDRKPAAGNQAPPDDFDSERIPF